MTTKAAATRRRSPAAEQHEQRFEQMGQAISTLEVHVQHLQSDLQGDRRERKIWQEQLDARIDKIAAAQSEGAKTNWSPLFAGLTVLLGVVTTVGGMAFAPVWGELSRLERRDSELEHEAKKWNAESFATLDRIGELRRELLEQKIATTSGRIDGLEHRLADHMANGHPHTVLREIERVNGEVKSIQANRFTPADAMEFLRKEQGRHEANHSLPD